MEQTPDRSCKRCSVARVNALIKAYNQAHDGSEPFLPGLRRLSRICQDKGYSGAERLLRPGLDEKALRALCWNVSSFLEDHEVESSLGVKL